MPTDLHEAYARVLGQLRGWISDSIPRQRRRPWSGGHDEGSFTSSWGCCHLLTGDTNVIDFLRWLRDGFAQWSAENQFHGFFKTGEVHHQTEVYGIFLTNLFLLDPLDRKTVRLIEDAAHHVGNWVPDVVPWYDERANRFRSWRIGSQEVLSDPPHDYEVPDHFRLIRIALSAYAGTGDERYLDLSRRYAGKWADLIVKAPVDEPPRILLRDGASPKDYGIDEVSLASGATHSGGGRTDMIEPHIAAGTVDVLLDLFLLTREDRFAAAARNLVEGMLPEIVDPYAQPPGALIARYRAVAGDDAFDEKIMELIASRPRPDLAGSVMIVETRHHRAVPGLGKRQDMLRWGRRTEDGALEEIAYPPPSSLVLAWEISGEERYLIDAFGIAAVRMALARALRDGRDHGCTGTAVAAAASGHGRDAGYGNITAVLEPAAFGRRLAPGDGYLPVTYSRNGAVGLPEGVSAVRAPGEAGKLGVRLENASDWAQTLAVTPSSQTKGGGTTVSVTIEPGAIETI